jgi:hypothetical protein
MSGYSIQAHGAHFTHLAQRHFLRVLFTLYGFLIFLGVMPKAPPRGPFASTFEHLFLSVANPLVGLLALAAVVAAAFTIWSAIRTLRQAPLPTAH